MKILEEKASCCGCKACYNVCPHQCITFEKDKEGFWYPVIDEKNVLNVDCVRMHAR